MSNLSNQRLIYLLLFIIVILIVACMTILFNYRSSNNLHKKRTTEKQKQLSRDQSKRKRHLKKPKDRAYNSGRYVHKGSPSNEDFGIKGNVDLGDDDFGIETNKDFGVKDAIEGSGISNSFNISNNKTNVLTFGISTKNSGNINNKKYPKSVRLVDDLNNYH